MAGGRHADWGNKEAKPSPFRRWRPPHENMPLAKDLFHPSPEGEKRKHKKKRLVQSPSSYFMDVKCPGCYKITTVFSHAQTVVLCVGCSSVLCQPTGGKARLTEGCSFRQKQHWNLPVSRWAGNHPNKQVLDTKKKKKRSQAHIHHNWKSIENVWKLWINK